MTRGRSETETGARTPSNDWLDLRQQDTGQFALTLTESLVRLDGQLFGGAGAAAIVGAVGAATGRDPLWATVQFASSAQIGDTLRVDVEVLANGHRASQVRATASCDGRVVLAGLGTVAAANEDGLVADFGRMPQVSAPEDSEPWRHFFPIDMDGPMTGPFRIAEFRSAETTPDDATGEHPHMWVRMHDSLQTIESVAFLADFVPGAVVRAAGRVGVGTSMDNTIRYGRPPATDWILIESDPYFAHAGFVHGAARVWSEDGILVAVASQTARAHLFD